MPRSSAAALPDGRPDLTSRTRIGLIRRRRRFAPAVASALPFARQQFEAAVVDTLT